MRLSAEAVDLVAARLRVFGEPTRIRLMELLDAQPEATVQELTDRLTTTHQNVSKHLAVLYQAGLVRRRKDGTTVRYRLVDWVGWWVITQLATSVSQQHDDAEEDPCVDHP